MKLLGTPTLKVVDHAGTDITTSVAGDYIITYSSDASSEADYETATYTSTYTPTTTMIKVTNTAGIP